MNKNIKVIIKAKTKSSITEDIGELELRSFSIFAGENNAGKTNLIKAIIEELEIQKINIINIPAERVLPDVEIKTGADKDPFKIAVAELLNVTFDDSKLIESLVDDIEKALPVEFSRYNIDKMELSAKTKTIPNDDYIKAIKDVYIKKIIDSITMKDCYCNKEGIKLSEVGQGTQRLIIASLLKYLGDKKGIKFSNQLTYIIFEEPEIYLHPKLKEGLFNTLRELVNNNKNIKIIITTHDPYFIELGNDFDVYMVDRSGIDNSTNLKKIEKGSYLPYKSSAEINYLIFDLPTPSYFLELYENIKDTYISKDNNNVYVSYKKFDDELSGILGIKQLEIDDNQQPVSFITRLRHDFAHIKSDLSAENFKNSGKDSIEKLIEYKKLKKY